MRTGPSEWVWQHLQKTAYFQLQPNYRLVNSAAMDAAMLELKIAK